jgi:radical SAM superfamily enzyme YgiQ (UPF0313 family)
MKTVLVSTYDLGHQPFALASAAAWLRAGLIAIHLPMHTATRLAVAAVSEIRALNAAAHICFFGLYAPLNRTFLRGIGGDSVIGGEFEGALAGLYRRLAAGGAGPGAVEEAAAEAAEEEAAVIRLDKQRFLVPERDGLPPLARYGSVDMGGGRTRVIGYTEASRGCKHLCRHCPVVPVYGGQFRVVQAEIVLADIDRMVAAGAQHITFGDPDFFNGIGHSLPIVEALADRFSDLTYDVTIKIEHLIKHAGALATLARTGCCTVTTAVESVDDALLGILDKGHTRRDFRHAVALARDAGLHLAPTFIPFTPWTTGEGFLELLREIAGLGLIDNVQPVQLAIRLLVPRGSRLLDCAELHRHLDGYDDAALSYRWIDPDAAVAALYRDVSRTVEEFEAAGKGRHDIFTALWRRAHAACGIPPAPLPASAQPDGARAPRFSEAWYCCAEPTGKHYAGA